MRDQHRPAAHPRPPLPEHELDRLLADFHSSARASLETNLDHQAGLRAVLDTSPADLAPAVPARPGRWRATDAWQRGAIRHARARLRRTPARARLARLHGAHGVDTLVTRAPRHWWLVLVAAVNVAIVVVSWLAQPVLGPPDGTIGAQQVIRLQAYPWSEDINPQMALSPDSTVLASSSYDGSSYEGMVRLWDARTGKPIGQPLNGHTLLSGGSLGKGAVEFSPDGTVLASSSYEGMVRLWDARTGKPIGQPLNSKAQTLNAVAFSPDGTRLTSAGPDGIVRVWRVAASRS